MKVIFAWWWSWGHILPSIAIAKRLNCEILFICSKWKLDAKMLSEYKFNFSAISAWKIRRYFDVKNISDILLFIYWIIESLFYIFRFSPDIIFCKWWYVSLPVAIAWWILRKKIILHESDWVMWIANKITSYFSSHVIMWLEQNLNPVRFEAKNVNKADINTNWKKLLFIMWWSQWAKQLNDLIVGIFPIIKEKYFVVHLTWIWKRTSIISKNYIQFEYLDKEYANYLKLSDFIISRSWASSIAEILAFKKPSILIPLVWSASNHQEINAKYVYNQKLCFMLESKIINHENIISIINDDKAIAELSKRLKLIKVNDVIGEIIKLINNISNK